MVWHGQWQPATDTTPQTGSTTWTIATAIATEDPSHWCSDHTCTCTNYLVDQINLLKLKMIKSLGFLWRSPIPTRSTRECRERQTIRFSGSVTVKQSARVLLTGSHFQFAGAVAWSSLRSTTRRLPTSQPNGRRMARKPQQASTDWWEETQDCWIRHHVSGQCTAFHPAACQDGPDLHDFQAQRLTEVNVNNRTSTIQDSFRIHGLRVTVCIACLHNHGPDPLLSISRRRGKFFTPKGSMLATSSWTSSTASSSMTKNSRSLRVCRMSPLLHGKAIVWNVRRWTP